MKRVIGKRRSLMAPVPRVQTALDDPRVETFAELEQILSSTSSVDAIKIFYAAKDGIDSSTQAIKSLGMTQKRYYTHLKRLIDSGLIEKVDGAYRLTTLGKISSKLGEVFTNALKYRNRLDLVDKLGKAKNITVEETEEIMRAILKDTNIISSEHVSNILSPVRIVDTWEKVVQDIIKYINNAEEEILFVTQHIDIRMIEALIHAGQRGIRMRFLINDIENKTGATQSLLRTPLTHSSSLRFMLKFINSAELKVKQLNIPYAFIVVDQKFSMIEVAKPLTKAFFFAFFFHNKKLADRIVDSFEVLWTEASKVEFIPNMRDT